MPLFSVGAVSSRLVRKMFSILKSELKFSWFAFPISRLSVMFNIWTLCVYSSSHSVSVPFIPSNDDEKLSAIGRNIFALWDLTLLLKDDFYRYSLVPYTQRMQYELSVGFSLCCFSEGRRI